MEDIERIRREHGLDLNTTDEHAKRAVSSLKTNLSNSLKNLSEELYTKDLHFVLEFIQNADDNIYANGVTPTLEFKLDATKQVSLARTVGKSTKKNLEGYIGEKGIGFKAVFTIANVVHILSGHYAFKFDNSGSEELGMIAPIWTREYDVEPGWTTFRLSIRPNVDLNSLSQKLSAVGPTLLLFLRQLRQLDIVVNGRHRHLSRSDEPNGITVLGPDHGKNRYVMIRHVVSGLPSDAQRLNVHTSEIVLAFPVSSSGEPVISDQDVHTFLPLRSFGFSFIIQADFLTTANREDILANRPWNVTLRDAISTTFIKALDVFRAGAGLEYNWLQYIPRHVSNEFMVPIVTSIRKQLRLRGEDGNLHLPNNLIIVLQKFQTEASTPLVPERFMGSLRYLDGRYNYTRDAGVLKHLGVRIMSTDNFLSGLSNMNQQVSKQDNTWLERTCSTLRSLANEWKSSYRNRIQKLRLVPLESGTWETARGTDIFFVDASVSDIPKDLPMRFVRQDPPLTQEHRRLLEDLGLKVATPAEIANQILTCHRQRTPAAKFALVHAKFIFSHTSLTAARLKVRCSDNIVRDGMSVYMDFPFDPPKIALSKVLQPHGAHFLHSDYYTLLPSGSSDAQRWFQWLRDALKVNVSPYFDGSDFRNEFWRLVAQPSSPILQVLRDYWHFFSTKLQTPGAAGTLKRLSAIPVLCSDNQTHRVDQTYLGRNTLRSRFPELLFVSVEDVENPDWNFLAALGVTFSVSCMFYLKRLIECSQGRHNVTPGEVVNLYEQISSRFDDEGTQGNIRLAFRENAIICIPPAAHGAQPESQANIPVRWLSSKDVFWTGPRSVFSKPILKSFDSYAPLRRFFAEQLRVPSCPDNILLHELQIVDRKFAGKPLTPEEHGLVFNLLKDIDWNIPSGRGNRLSRPIDWLKDLKTLAVFPATAATNSVQLYKPGQVYDPRESGDLFKLFSGKVPLLVAPEEEKLWYLKTLLSSEACDDVKALRDEVRKEVVHHERYGADCDRVNASLSKRYLARLEVLQRITLWRRRDTLRIADLTDLIVYEVEELFCQYTLGNIKTDKEPQALVMGIDRGGQRLVVWRCRTGQDQGNDFEFAAAFANEWKIDFEAVYMAISLPDASLKNYLTRHEVPSLTSLRGSFEYSSTMVPSGFQVVSSDEDVSKPLVSTDDASSCIPVSHKKSRRKRGAHSQPSFEAETETLIRDYDLKLRQVAQDRVLSKSMHTLEGLFENSSIQPMPFSNGLELCNTSNLEAASPRSVSQTYASSYDDADGEIPRSRHVTSSMPTAEESTTGALGELWIYHLLSNKLPQFTADNWTSELRYYASGRKLAPYTGTSLSDFCYEDTTGALTKMLLGEDSILAEQWGLRYPRYHLEVKSTEGDQYTPCHLSRAQLRTMSAMTIRDVDGSVNVPEDVFVLIRVWNLRLNNLEHVQCQAYLDPHKLLYTGQIYIDSEDGVSVVIQR